MATTHHPDVMGNTVWFTGISENTKTAGDPEPLYGEPTALGDTLDFDPNILDFEAESAGPEVDTTSGSLSLMIQAKPGFYLHSLLMGESGLANLFTLDGDPFAAVTGLMEVTINHIDGSPVSPIKLPAIIPTYSPSDGDFQHSVDAVAPLFTSDWNGSAGVDLEAALVDNDIPHLNGVTKVTIAIDNLLLAAAGNIGSSAYIDKMDFFIEADTWGFPPIPEPATMLLAFTGMIGTLTMRRRSL